MQIEIPLDEDVINAAVEKAVSEIDDILDGVDVEELVRGRISHISDSDMLDGIDVESLVRDEIADRDVLDGIDVEALVNDQIEAVDLLEGIDLEKIVTGLIRRSINEDDYRQYIISVNLVKALEDELEELRVDFNKLKFHITSRELPQARKWYQIW